MVALCSAGVSEALAQKAIFNHTGADQVFVVPAGVTRLKVKLWGAGGGANGGSGAFVTGILTVTPGESLTVIVGSGGTFSISFEAGAYGGGGAGFHSRGGGRSALRRGDSELVTAGAGGGGRYGNDAGGGAGGLLSGGDGWLLTGFATAAGKGGTQSAGGAGGVFSFAGGNGQAGSAFQGGAGSIGGPGGGGGYFGGGGGVNDGGGGGGGSSFLANLTEASASAAGQAAANNGASVLPGGASDPDYAFGIGIGGAWQSAGGHGRVVLMYEAPSLIVTTAADVVDAFDGQTSLREALAHAATLTGPQTVTFSATTANGAVNFHDGTARSITVLATALPVGGEVTVAGPGRDRLTLSGADATRVMRVLAGAKATLLDLAIKNGRGVSDGPGAQNIGGGIRSEGALSVVRCRFADNSAGNAGGGIHTVGALQVEDCVKWGR